MPENHTNNPHDSGDDGARMARRQLLKLGLWITPAIVATFILDRPGLAATCGPQSCNPVNPGSCGPASGCGPGSGCAPVTGCGPSSN